MPLLADSCRTVRMLKVVEADCCGVPESCTCVERLNKVPAPLDASAVPEMVPEGSNVNPEGSGDPNVNVKGLVPPLIGILAE